MKRIFLVASVLAGLAISSCNNGTSESNSSNTTDSVDSKKQATDMNKEKFDSSNIKPDTKFAVKAADGGMLEVQLGNLALTKANSPEVKNLGQMMVDDHSKANAELKTLATSKNISIPAALGSDNQHKLTELSAKTGNDFDKAYAELMVSDHKEDIDDFKKEANDGKDAEVKAWAAGKVSTLEHHLQMAQSTEKVVKNKKGK